VKSKRFHAARKRTDLFTRSNLRQRARTRCKQGENDETINHPFWHFHPSITSFAHFFAAYRLCLLPVSPQNDHDVCRSYLIPSASFEWMTMMEVNFLQSITVASEIPSDKLEQR
jgi:hypothetical protein